MKRFSPLLATFALVTSALATETDGPVRDPSRMVKRGDTYWVYGTGLGTQQFSSRDRVNWTNHGPALLATPGWVKAAVPDNKDGAVRAPDVIARGGKYFLFYSFSAGGTNTSAIGVATNDTLDPRGWKDQGMVIASTGKESFNAIDPCGFEDAEGNFWMAFGSYVGGLRLIRLDPNTGLRWAGDDKIHEIATRPGLAVNTIEAAYIHFRDGWYYLFVNFDWCCRGIKSSYNIRVGRSRTVTGPYVDKAGKSLNEGGGTLFLNAVHDSENGRPVDDLVGPGQVGILQEGNNFWLSTHYEWTRKTSRTMMHVQRLAWDEDGWPRAVLDAGPWKMVSNLPTYALAAPAGAPEVGARLATAPDLNRADQRWRLEHLGQGFYAIRAFVGNLALGTEDNSGAQGAQVELRPYAGGAGQQWFAQQNEDGTLTFLSKASGLKQALDVGGCNAADGAEIHTWDSNGLDCQKWRLRVR